MQMQPIVADILQSEADQLNDSTVSLAKNKVILTVTSVTVLVTVLIPVSDTPTCKRKPFAVCAAESWITEILFHT